MKIFRFLSLPTDRKWLFAEAVIRLLALRLAFVLLGYRRMVAHFGICEPVPALTETSVSVQARDAQMARAVGWAVIAASRHVPFTGPCLHQALVARRMLFRRGIVATMYFGNNPDRRICEAENHAWLCLGDIPVTGYPFARRCVAYARFSCDRTPSGRIARRQFPPKDPV